MSAPVLAVFCLLLAASPVLGTSPLGVRVAQRAVDAQNCGGCEFATSFTMSTTESGWIIEGFFSKNLRSDCEGNYTGPPENPFAVSYWLGWRVDCGQVYQGFADKPHYAQLFRTPSDATGQKGRVVRAGVAGFLKDYTTNASLWEFGRIPEAGQLPTRTTTPPGVSTADLNLLVGLGVDWNCCGYVHPVKIDTFPRSAPQTQAPRTAIAAGSSMSSSVTTLERVFAACPVWDTTTESSPQIAAAILSVMRLLARQDLFNLRAQIAAYEATHRLDVAGMSKVFLLNRVVFAVPGLIRLGSIPFFGGWHGIPIHGGLVNVLWPFSVSDSGELRLTGAGFGGYTGEPYSAVDEFDHFNRRFGRRDH